MFIFTRITTVSLPRLRMSTSQLPVRRSWPYNFFSAYRWAKRDLWLPEPMKDDTPDSPLSTRNTSFSLMPPSGLNTRRICYAIFIIAKVPRVQETILDLSLLDKFAFFRRNTATKASGNAPPLGISPAAFRRSRSNLTKSSSMFRAVLRKCRNLATSWCAEPLASGAK